MGILTRLLGADESRATLKNPDKALIQALRGQTATSAGVYLSDEAALTYGAVLACTRVLSESVACLSCLLYERGEDERRQRARKHRLFRVLHNRPNPEMTAFEFWEMVVVHLLLWGNFYAEIVFDGAGNVSQLWPLPPNRVAIERDAAKQLVYRINLDSGPRYFDDEFVFHVPAMRTTGLKGLSVVGQAREAIGLGVAAERFGSSVFGNGTVPGGVLTHPGTLGDKAYERLKSSWEQRHQGLDNAQRLAILEEGLKYEKTGIPPEDAQFLETRKFQRSEIAGMFRVPPHMIGDLDRATFGNIEQQSLEFVVYTLQPYLRRIENRINSWLLMEGEQERYFAEFLVDSLLRGDTTSRNQAYSIGRQWGWLSVNEIRQRENMNPVPGGDVYLQPLNMVDAGAPPARPAVDQGARAGAMGRRELRSATMDRRRVIEVQRPALQDAAQRVVNREVNDIRNAARRLLKNATSSDDFVRWLRTFCEDHRDFIEERLWPTWFSMAQLVGNAALVEAEEVGYGQQDVAANVEAFARGMLQSRAVGWAERLRVGLEKKLGVNDGRAARAADAGDETWLREVEDVLDKRQADEAEDWARDTGVAAGNAVAVVVWTVLGVLMLRWVSFGNSCDHCSALNGRAVGIREFFVMAGVGVTVEGKLPLIPGSNIRHPPLHGGCDCLVVPE